jgi:hypothetical protein
MAATPSVSCYRGGIVQALTLFTVVDPSRIIVADPLTPAMQLELVMDFMAGEMRMAHKPQMRLIAGFGKSLG